MKRLSALFVTLSIIIVANINSNQLIEGRRLPATVRGHYGCDEFFAQLNREQPTSVAQALNILKQESPETLSHYTIGYQSRSLHESSFTNPRIIAFNTNAKMIVSFNGDPNQNGYERLEMMCFNDKHSSFEFRDVAFPREAKSEDDLYDIPRDKRSSAFVISPVNGHQERSCTQCHGDPARPIWDTYNLWPGFCQSQLHKGEHFNSSEEDQNCRRFESAMSQHERYRNLNSQDEHQKLRINETLGMELGRLVTKKIVKDLDRQSISVRQIRYQLAHALLCPDLKPFVPSEHGYTDDYLPTNQMNYNSVDISHLGPRQLSPRAREMLLDNMKYHGERLHRTENNFPNRTVINSQNGQIKSPYGPRAVKFLSDYYQVSPKNSFEAAGLYDSARVIEDVLILSELERLLEPIGVDVRSWSTQLHGGYGHEGHIVWPILAKHFMERFLPEEKEILKAMPVFEREATQKLCSKLDPKAEAEKLKTNRLSEPTSGSQRSQF